MITQDDINAFSEEETEESFEARLRRISEEVKADIKAGRYRHGQLRPEISAKQPKRLAIEEGKLFGFDSWQKEIMKLMMSESFEGTMTGRFSRRSVPFHEMYGGQRIDSIIMDEGLHIKPEGYWLGYGRAATDKEGSERDGPKKMYWSQPIPEKGSSTPPSDAKRAALRAKRKKHKK